MTVVNGFNVDDGSLDAHGPVLSLSGLSPSRGNDALTSVHSVIGSCNYFDEGGLNLRYCVVFSGIAVRLGCPTSNMRGNSEHGY